MRVNHCKCLASVIGLALFLSACGSPIIAQTGNQGDNKQNTITDSEDSSIVNIDISQQTNGQKGESQPLTDEDTFQSSTIGTDFYITDVLLSSTGESVQYVDAPVAIVPKFNEDNIVELTIKGLFKAPEVGMTLANMQFNRGAGILHQTYLENSINDPPLVKVLLNDTLLFSPVELTDNATETVLKVNVNTRLIPDFYLQGMHHLSVSAGRKMSSTLIKVGEPDPNATIPNLQPVIDTVEVVRGDNILDLKVTGKNFFVQPKFTYAQIDGVFGFGHATVIKEDGTFITLIHVPNHEAFNSQSVHSLSFITPYGIALKDFTVAIP